MYVEHWIPAQVRHPYPVVLIHGGFGQGSDWFSNPDGSRGWATLFLEQGYKVYVLDRPGQGRNPYQPFVHGAFDRAGSHVRSGQPGRMNLPISDPRVAQAVAPMGQPMAQLRNDANRLAHARGDAARRYRPVDPGDRWRRRVIRASNCRRASGAGQRMSVDPSPPPAGTAFKVFHHLHSEQPGTRILCRRF